ncbi:hypothetical protein ABOM_001648, partial [Aspergillus bombycis]
MRRYENRQLSWATSLCLTSPAVAVADACITKEKDVEKLIPWVFQYSDTAEEDCTMSWPEVEYKFRHFFDEVSSYCAELKGQESSGTGVASVLRASETVTLLTKNWKVSEREYFKHFIRWQGVMLGMLMKTIYFSLGIKTQDPNIQFALLGLKLKYVIGGKQFIARAEGAATVDGLPIISYTGWFRKQTWSEFLGETLSVMLGQLAKNLSMQTGGAGSREQEVFVIGFHGLYLHIARGLFTASMISRVHSKGCSENEVFELKFTQGYNLCSKKDWLEATRALSRLYRYLLSGKAKVGAIQAYMQRGPDTTDA